MLSSNHTNIILDRWLIFTIITVLQKNTILKTCKGTTRTDPQMVYEYHKICEQFNVRIALDKKSSADCVCAGNICTLLLIKIFRYQSLTVSDGSKTNLIIYYYKDKILLTHISRRKFVG